VIATRLTEMVHGLFVAKKEYVMIGQAGKNSKPLVGPGTFPLVGPNNYGRGSNSMSPFRMARIAA
jgi:hypothetical protein